MDENKASRLWKLLTSDVGRYRDLENSRPLLAHYTSINVVESILKKPCFWMSNPLNMNDYQEVAHGINVAIQEAQISQSLRKAFEDEEIYREFIKGLLAEYDSYGTYEVKNLFVTCFSECEDSDLPDGKLSMWRGYGDFGNGSAIVIDTKYLEPNNELPFVLAEVQYLSDEDRRQFIKSKIGELAEFIASERIKHVEARYAARMYFRRAALGAIFSKHKGFSEEREWRLAYLPDRDREEKFAHMIDVAQGINGLEPKMKLALTEEAGTESLKIDFDNMLYAIIIGPRSASPLSHHAAGILLKKMGKGNLREKLMMSTIPFRSQK